MTIAVNINNDRTQDKINFPRQIRNHPKVSALSLSLSSANSHKNKNKNDPLSLSSRENERT